MEQIINISISMPDLRVLIKDIINEYMLEYSQQNPNSRSDLFSYAQVFERFYLRPDTLAKWKEKGLINEYPVGKTVKFKISELMKAAQQVLMEMNSSNKEVSL